MRLEIIEVRSPAPSSAVPVLSAAVPVAGTRLAEAASGLKQRSYVTRLRYQVNRKRERRDANSRAEGRGRRFFALATQDGGRVALPSRTGTFVIV